MFEDKTRKCENNKKTIKMKSLFWENRFLLFFGPPESPRNDSLRVKMCLECVHVCKMAPPI